MSFDKNYPNRKDHRKTYTDSRAFDRSCRHGGNCGYCKGNRTINSTRKKAEANDVLSHVNEDLRDEVEQEEDEMIEE